MLVAVLLSDLVFLNFLYSIVSAVREWSRSLEIFSDDDVDSTGSDLYDLDDFRSFLVRFLLASSSTVFLTTGEWLRKRLLVDVDLLLGDCMMINGVGSLTLSVSTKLWGKIWEHKYLWKSVLEVRCWCSVWRVTRDASHERMHLSKAASLMRHMDH